ncbi:hypothetical protein [Formosa haliotis]|uniref:hypothetical protein n=1 Tax=Formosa haliotis TaxID=1555194 RepID=UPI0008257378|nr:hypothetical protein [Formosa haliotis]
MAQKDRNNITQAIEGNVRDNNNKEITAEMIRSVLADFRDSYFNLIDDYLANLKYDNQYTLAEILAQSANVPPLWGSSDFFDPGSTDGNIVEYNDNGNGTGIVQSMSYLSLGGPDCEITLNLSKSISNKKLVVSYFTDNTNLNSHNDFCAPIIRVVHSQAVKIGIREIAGAVNKLRIELFAFTVDKGN